MDEKFAWNRSISYLFLDISNVSFSTKIQDGHQKWWKLKFFPFAQDTLILPGEKFARNRISLTVAEIFTIFHFPLKSKMAAKSGENWIFFPRHRILLYGPMSQKFTRNRYISYRFSRYSHFFIFCLNPRWLPKVVNIEIFFLWIRYSCTTLWVKIHSKLLYFLLFARYLWFFTFSLKVAIK